MEKFFLLHTIMWQMVMQLRLVSATPIRKDEDEYNQRLKKKSHMIMIVENSLAELDKHGLVQEGSIGPTLDKLKQLKESLILIDRPTIPHSDHPLL